MQLFNYLNISILFKYLYNIYLCLECKRGTGSLFVSDILSYRPTCWTRPSRENGVTRNICTVIRLVRI